MRKSLLLLAVTVMGGCTATQQHQQRAASPTAVHNILLPFLARVLNDQSSHGRWQMVGSGSDEATSDAEGGKSYFRRIAVREGLVKKAKEAEFMSTFRSGIGGVLGSTGVTVHKREAGPDHFEFSYTDGSTIGSLDIWGVRGPGDHFKLIFVLYEN